MVQVDDLSITTDGHTMLILVYLCVCGLSGLRIDPGQVRQIPFISPVCRCEQLRKGESGAL